MRYYFSRTTHNGDTIMAKHTYTESYLIVIIGTILFLGSCFYDNIVTMIAGAIIMGYFLGCETKE